MGDKPIPFKDALVLAAERGNKTVTRRLVRDREGSAPPTDATFREWHLDGAYACFDAPSLGPGLEWCAKAKYRVGDRLWVKQRLVRDSEGLITYGTTGERVTSGLRGIWPWKPRVLGAMYCPRWASRLTLEVVDVRVERLLQITVADALAEGVDPDTVPSNDRGWSALEAFRQLWDEINGKRQGASWAANPWVYRIEFRRVPDAP